MGLNRLENAAGVIDQVNDVLIDVKDRDLARALTAWSAGFYGLAYDTAQFWIKGLHIMPDIPLGDGQTVTIFQYNGLSFPEIIELEITNDKLEKNIPGVRKSRGRDLSSSEDKTGNWI